MHDLQMVDLKRQYHKIKPEIDAAIQRVIDSAAFIKGEDVDAFATELAAYLGVKHVYPLWQWHRCLANNPYGTWPSAWR